MIADRPTEQRIRGWLLATSPSRAPNAVLDRTFERTRRLGQHSKRTAWLPRRGRVPIGFGLAALVVIVVASVSVISVGTSPLFGPASRPLGVQFGSSAPISGIWTTDAGVAATVERDPSDDRSFYWRAAVFDQFDRTAWRSSSGGTADRAAGSRVLEGMADDAEGAWLEPVTVTVEPLDFQSSTVLSPGTSLTVDSDVQVNTIGNDGYFASLDRGGSGPYTVTALVADTGDGALTAGALRAAGTDYPPEVAELYTPVAVGTFGPNLRALRDEIVRTANSTAPIDIAQRLVEVLHSPGEFRYDTDVRDLACDQMSTAECFATFKRGYCQYYATTMAVILRDLGIPDAARSRVPPWPADRGCDD